ncbi:MAG: complex I NDUFA9 subunit family protein [Acetobacter sp.]|nr:complex I NDUFA9 subunit family protein [Acetobacter sp.]
MNKAKIATVFGSNGFVGQYVVQQLALAGYRVRAASCGPDYGMLLRYLGRVGQVAPFYASVTDEKSVACAVKGADLVVNLTAVLSMSDRHSLKTVNIEGAGCVARLAAEAGVRRFIHMSDLAVSASTSVHSLYIKSRLKGEAQVHHYQPEAAIIRPSVIFGAEDKFFNLLAGFARYLPFLPICQGNTKLQPVYVGDVSRIVVAVAQKTEHVGGIWSVGGPSIMTMRESATFVLKETRRNKSVIEVPSWIVGLGASLCRYWPGVIRTRNIMQALTIESIVHEENNAFDAFGMTPRSVVSCVPSYLERYRKGGSPFGVIIGEL